MDGRGRQAPALGVRLRDPNAVGLADRDRARLGLQAFKDANGLGRHAGVTAKMRIDAIRAYHGELQGLSRIKRQDAIVLQEDDGLLRRMARQLGPCPICEHPRRDGGFHIGMFEQPRLELQGQDTRDRGVDGLFLDSAAFHQIRQKRIARPLRQVHVDTGVHGQHGGPRLVRGHMMKGGQFLDGTIIADVGALEAEQLTPVILQKVAIGVRGDAAHFVVRSHNQSDVALADGLCERR